MRIAGGAVAARFLPAAASVAGVLLLALGVADGVQTSHERIVAQLDAELGTTAGRQAIALAESFGRAADLNLLLARDGAFADLYRDSTDVLATARQGGPATWRVTAAMRHLQDLHPDAVSEICFIDRGGAELARVVDRQVALSPALSPDERGNAFFAPTLRLGPDQVLQARPYRSPDTADWVVSASSPIRADGGGVQAVLHFEIPLETLRRSLTGADELAVVDAGTGRVLLAGADPLRRGGPLGPTDARFDRAATRAASTGADGGSFGLGGHRYAFARVRTGPQNQNQWLVLARSPAVVPSWWRTVGTGPLVLLTGAVLLLALGVLVARTHRREVREAALRDALTGLPNRLLLADRTDRAVALACRQQRSAALLLLDLDRFKEVNDTLGHQYGDRLLVAVAQRLDGVLRASDTVARLGGDEFAVLLPDLPRAEAAEQVARKVLDALSTSFPLGDTLLDVEASIGIAIAPDHGLDAETLLRHADVAMYQAKAEHAGWSVYRAESDANTPGRLALLGDLRRALEAGELVVHYQPKVDLHTDELHGVEALVRWQHPTRGLLPPGDFIPLAENTGLIYRLTLHVLELAVRQAVLWRDRGCPVQVAVNLSARCLTDPALPGDVAGLLEQTGLEPRWLRLEITESSIMADPAVALHNLHQVHALGIGLSIDDFGTGYSSMAYLKLLPLDELKVDRSFIADLPAHPEDTVLIRSAVDLGHNLGMHVVAEGVEDEPTLETLRSLGCDVVQGYFTGRPMPLAQLDEWMAARSARSAESARSAGAVSTGRDRPVAAGTGPAAD